MTEPVAPPPPTEPEPVPDDPRRLVQADLVRQLLSGLMAQAAAYERAASHAGGVLRQSLVDLYRAMEAEIAELTPLARALGVTTPAAPPSPPGPERPWGVVLGAAVQAERRVEGGW